MTVAEVRKQWTDALRSGAYEQGKHCLQISGRFCCLGVLCDILDPQGWGAEPGPSGIVRHRAMLGMPIDDILWAAGVSPAGATSLTSLNDTGSSFLTIAATIETLPEMVG